MILTIIWNGFFWDIINRLAFFMEKQYVFYEAEIEPLNIGWINIG
jgi:hypothetical protein